MASRDDGFRLADISTSHFDKAKTRALWRLLAPDVDAMCRALTLHQATVLASWREGKRTTVDDSAPLWLPVTAPLVEALVAARLLDSTGRVPTASWARYFAPARARRAARVEAGRLGGIASGKGRRSDASASPNLTGRLAGPSVRPSDHPVPPAGDRAKGRGRRGPTSLADAMKETPFGKEIEQRREAG